MAYQSIYNINNISPSILGYKYLVFQKFLRFFTSLYPSGILKVFIENNEMELHVRKEHLLNFFKLVKDHS